MASQAFDETGYHLVRNLLPRDKVDEYVRFINELRADPSGSKFRRPRDGYAEVDGITQRRELWDLIVDPAIVGTVRELIGPDIMYVRHTDIHWNHPIYPGWHRDSTMHISKIFARHRVVPYVVVRALLYLTDTTFTILNDSHQKTAYFADSIGNNMMRGARRLGYNHLLSPPGRKTHLQLSPGDCLFMNVLLFHTGCYLDRPKGGVFLSYGLKNQNSIDHSSDYASRSGLPMPDDLRALLDQHQL